MWKDKLFYIVRMWNFGNLLFWTLLILTAIIWPKFNENLGSVVFAISLISLFIVSGLESRKYTQAFNNEHRSTEEDTVIKAQEKHQEITLACGLMLLTSTINTIILYAVFPQMGTVWMAGLLLMTAATLFIVVQLFLATIKKGRDVNERVLISLHFLWLAIFAVSIGPVFYCFITNPGVAHNVGAAGCALTGWLVICCLLYSIARIFCSHEEIFFGY